MSTSSTNSQITGRVTPRLLDLVVALAAGTAGAFAMSRDDVADSLPGVAVSIALVPPLCVVGISLSAGEWDHTWGALLLFLTNLLSILLAGGAIFALLGLGKGNDRRYQTARQDGGLTESSRLASCSSRFLSRWQPSESLVTASLR